MFTYETLARHPGAFRSLTGMTPDAFDHLLTDFRGALDRRRRTSRTTRAGQPRRRAAGAGRGQPRPAAAVRVGGAGAAGRGRGGDGGQGLRGAEELLPGCAGGDPVQGEPESPPDGGAGGVQPGGGALPGRGGAHAGAAEPVHGAAAGVPGSAAGAAWPGDPCGGEAGEPAAARQAAEDLRRVRAGHPAGRETDPWYCATTLIAEVAAGTEVAA